MKNALRFAAIFLIVSASACTHRLRDGEYSLTVLSTDDVHGAWFDSTYTGGGTRRSLLAINTCVDSVRTADGAGNVLLIDVGDCLQGDNAAYYYNYVDTVSPHLFPRLMAYMGYDAVVVGNHDVETGHAVYDRVARDLKKAGIDFLAGNYLRDDGKPYFLPYKMVERGGLRVAVIGYGNANIPGWLPEKLWTGMHFVPIMDVIQADVDRIRAKEKPDVVIAAMHAATGKGDGSILEAEALDAFNGTKGVDFVLCGHDHRARVENRDTSVLLNAGSHSRYVACGKLHLTVSGGKVVAKNMDAHLIPVRAEKADPVMREVFHPEFEAVKAFTLKEVGRLETDFYTRDSYKGMSLYLDFIHTVILEDSPSEISFESPLTYNGVIHEGTLLYNDLFTLYPYENSLYVVNLTGEEIHRYLEASYDRWINTVRGPKDHLLRIEGGDDARTGQARWHFINRSYNFSSAAGICYTVDVTKPAGERVTILSMASGEPFDSERTYAVGMTSYRASGGGGLLSEAGVDMSRIQERTVAILPEIREIIYQYLCRKPEVRVEDITRPEVIGSWAFIPEKTAEPLLEADMALLFGK